MSAHTPAIEEALRVWIRARAEAARVHEAVRTPADGDLPWRRLGTPARIIEGRVRIGGTWRVVLRTVDLRPMTRAVWHAVVARPGDLRGVPRNSGGEVFLSARAELDGGAAALVRGRCSSDPNGDVWEVVAYAE